MPEGHVLHRLARTLNADFRSGPVEVTSPQGRFATEAALIDASVAKVTMQQNSDMRTISAVVGMWAAPTLVAGIYGMNFDIMPELHWALGYPMAIIIMILVVVGLWAWFRKNHWL